MSNEEAYLKVQKKIKAKKGFYLHFGLYVIIIIFLTLINWLTGGHGGLFHIDWWVAFPAVCWGTAVAIHALAVFIFSGDGLLGEEWEQKKIEEELNKRGYTRDKDALLPQNEIDHLKLKQVEKRTNYNEQDLV
ncbi:MAG: 2TM domain-containing protein [Saprospiraceae bacterium]